VPRAKISARSREAICLRAIPGGFVVAPMFKETKRALSENCEIKEEILRNKNSNGDEENGTNPSVGPASQVNAAMADNRGIFRVFV